jgi:hypothetical protein
MRLRELFEAPESTAVMAFGRMNPPTIGHAKLVDAVKGQPGDPYIFLSQSQKPKTDPLAFADKLRYAKFFFPEVTIGNPEVKTIIQALQKIAALGYANLIYVAGSDRVASFEELINKYNGVEYNFNSIRVVSAGERDPDADGAEGMSASKMRAAAAAGDLESFKQGVPNQEVADEMYAAVRQGMGIRDKEAVPAESMKEQTVDPNKLMAFIKVDGEDQEFDLTPFILKYNWGSDTMTVIKQAEKWIGDFLRKRGTAYSNLTLSYKGASLKSNQIGDVGADLESVEEVAPPGREKQVKALKKKFDDPGAPYAIAWAQHNKKKRS